MNNLFKSSRALLKKLSGSNFVKDRAGVAALEFALIGALFLPAMLMGTIEVSQALRVNLMFEQSVEAFAQIAAANSNLTSTLLKDYCTGVKKMMSPWPTTNYKLAIASVTRGSSGGVGMDWEVDYSCSTTSLATAIGSSQAISLASSTVPNTGDTSLVVMGTFSFVTTTGNFLNYTIPLSQTTVVSPRGSSTTTCIGC